MTQSIATAEASDQRPDSPRMDVARLRAVFRTATELRRGVPVLLTGGAPLVLLAAETASPRGLEDFVALTREPATLLLAPVRAAVLLQRPIAQSTSVVALRLPLPAADALRGFADPTAEQLLAPGLQPAAVPPAAPAALALVKLARLLPALLAASPIPDAAQRSDELGLLSVAATDAVAYQSAAAVALRRVADVPVPLDVAENTRIVAFRSEDDGIEHLAILVGAPESREAPLLRLHSECFTGDLLGSLRCDCGSQLRGAICRMAEEGAGVLLYLAQEGRGIGLVNKLRAYALQDRGLDTLDANRALGWGADERSFLVAATMLDELGIRRIRLLTNNPDKVAALAACGIDVVSREPHAFAPNGVNDHYLATKARRFGHLLG